MNDSDRSNRPDPPPESAMGGTSDSGAHGRHPASNPDAPPLPEVAAGDAAIERRHGPSPGYRGPERRQGGRARTPA
jgi:hypothetical protein